MQPTATAALPGLLIEPQGPVARLTLNRPDKRNALSHALLAELEAALSRIAANASARVVVLAAAGPVFCSGHDLGEMTGRSEDEYRELFALCSRVMLHFRRLPQPVIARVHGLATAAGCQLVAACDLAVAAQGTRFGTPGVKIGLFCSTPMVPVSRAVGRKRAMQMLLTGEPIDADTALDWGLVNQVVPADELDQAVDRLTQAIARSSSYTVATGKRAFYDQIDRAEPDAYEHTKSVMTTNALAHDAQEGMSAFLQKRSPNWVGH
jgi:enoyl-CoA hydratase/carnithine racemase